MVKKSYYNTTHSSGADLQKFEIKAQSQEEQIEIWLSTKRHATPSQVQNGLMPLVPITSIRRAMTNLTHAGKLEKTERQIQGPYGRPEYVWAYVDPDPTQPKLL